MDIIIRALIRYHYYYRDKQSHTVKVENGILYNMFLSFIINSINLAPVRTSVPNHACSSYMTLMICKITSCTVHPHRRTMHTLHQWSELKTVMWYARLVNRLQHSPDKGLCRSWNLTKNHGDLVINPGKTAASAYWMCIRSLFIISITTRKTSTTCSQL